MEHLGCLNSRFNTTGGNLHLLSVQEIKRRTLEQKALGKQGMRQRVLLENEGIAVEGATATVIADRLISVKDIRSALIYKLSVQFARTKRSKLNPYGLVITSITEINEEQKSEGK